jgi:hypothetical protein
VSLEKGAHILNLQWKSILGSVPIRTNRGQFKKANKIRFYEEKNGADSDVSVFYLYKIAKACSYFGATNLTRMKQS